MKFPPLSLFHVYTLVHHVDGGQSCSLAVALGILLSPTQILMGGFIPRAVQIGIADVQLYTMTPPYLDEVRFALRLYRLLMYSCTQ